jgi:hypothetical protein
MEAMTGRRLGWALAAALVLVAACTDEGPVSGPGDVTATLIGPNGPEGAALVVLLGEGIGSVEPMGGTEAHSASADGAVQVLLIDQAGGDLSFRVALADTTRLPQAIVRQVAGPDDELRALEGYRVSFGR